MYNYFPRSCPQTHMPGNIFKATSTTELSFTTFLALPSVQVVVQLIAALILHLQKATIIQKRSSKKTQHLPRATGGFLSLLRFFVAVEKVSVFCVMTGKRPPGASKMEKRKREQEGQIFSLESRMN